MPARWAINASARWVDPPIQPDRPHFGVRGLTQTDIFRPFRTHNWVGPLEMP
jgi:hypothetical protein